MKHQQSIKIKLIRMQQNCKIIKIELNQIKQTHLKLIHSIKLQTYKSSINTFNTKIIPNKQNYNPNQKLIQHQLLPKYTSPNNQCSIKQHPTFKNNYHIKQHVTKNINQHIKPNQSIKNQIIQQLMELKMLQQRQNILRKTNQRIKQFYSQSKKKFEQNKYNSNIDSNNKNKPNDFIKQNYNTQNTDINHLQSKHPKQIINPSKLQLEKQSNKVNSVQTPSFKSKNQSINFNKNQQKNIGNITYCQSRCNQKELSLTQSEIQIQIQLPGKSTILLCPNNHEYYHGTLNSQHLPHGQGYLHFCCNKMPFLQSIKPSENCSNYAFYSGNFRNGKFEGLGTLKYEGKVQVKYVGQFKQGLRNGDGSLYCDGKVQLGVWQNDIFLKLL